MKKRAFAAGGEVPDFSRLSFKEAFQAARGGPDAKTPMNKTFTWNGTTYKTDLDKPKDKGPDQSQAETNRLRRQDDAAGPSVSARKVREPKMPEYTDDVNEAMLMGASGMGLGRKLGKELARAGELRAAAKMREGTSALKEASQGAKKVRDLTKDTEPMLGYKNGGSVSSASKRADGIATKGKTRGKMR